MSHRPKRLAEDARRCHSTHPKGTRLGRSAFLEGTFPVSGDGGSRHSRPRPSLPFLTLLVHQPHEGEAGHEADGPPEDQQGDIQAGEAEGLAGRVLNRAPRIPHQALQEAQQREEQQHQPAPPVYAARHRCQARQGSRRRRPSTPRLRRRRGHPIRLAMLSKRRRSGGRRRGQEGFPLLGAAPGCAHRREGGGGSPHLPVAGCLLS